MYRGKEFTAPRPLQESLGIGLQIIFILYVVFILVMGQTPVWKNLIDNVAINFLAITLEALPFMLIGTLVGGIIEVFVPATMIDRVFRKNRIQAVFLAGGMGLIFPTCECAIVPVVRRLLIKGVPFSAAITFLLAGPIVNPIVAWSTATAYTLSWEVVVTRMVCGYAIAVSVGLLIGKFFNRQNGLLPGLADSAHNSCGCLQPVDIESSLRERLGHAVDHAGNDFFAVGRYLVIGAFISALLRSAVPMETFTSLSSSPWLAILLMMVMAVLLNLCSEADAFIAASFRWVLPGSSQMAFMVLGPMFDIKLLLMYLSVFRKRVIVALSLSTFFSVLITMLALEYFWPGFIS
jgi:uncharacterized membrane protein YraQ (UPF0718 family)